jgi:hypothetical protein
MACERFWKWYDRGARVDFAATLLGYVFDWKGWVVTILSGGGGVATFLAAAIGGWSPLVVWVFATIVAAALAATTYFIIGILERRDKGKYNEPSPQPSQSVGEFSGDIPDLRVADDTVAWGLFGAPHNDKLLPLLERGKLEAWGRIGNGQRPLTLIPADQWRTHYLDNRPADGPGRINQTFFRPRGRPYESTYYDVHLNRSQLKRAWPEMGQ